MKLLLVPQLDSARMQTIRILDAMEGLHANNGDRHKENHHQHTAGVQHVVPAFCKSKK
jgi:hypothetical protein